MRLTPFVATLALVVMLVTPARAQVSPEASIQQTITRSNAAQAQAIALRDPTAIGEAPVGNYYQQLVRATRGLLANGVISIELTNIEWGPINVTGGSATATASGEPHTVEVRTFEANGSSSFRTFHLLVAC